MRRTLLLLVLATLPHGASFATEPLQPAPRFDTLPQRISYLLSLLKQVPDLIRSNLNFHRNPLEVLEALPELEKELGANFKNMGSRELAHVDIEFQTYPQLVPDPAKLQPVRDQLKLDLKKLEPASLQGFESDLRNLKAMALRNGTHDPSTHKKLIDSLLRLSPFLYSDTGKLLRPTEGKWTEAITSHIDALTSQSLYNSYRDLFEQHLKPLAEAVAKETGQGQIQSSLQSVRNQFIDKDVAVALAPTIEIAGSEGTRVLRLEEQLSPADFHRCKWGNDCSILSVPYYPTVEGTATYKIIDPSLADSHSRALGYAFFVMTSDGTQPPLPYIITINGPKLSVAEVEAVSYGVAHTKTAKEFYVPDFTENAALVNTGEARSGLNPKKKTAIRLQKPAGWDVVEKYQADNPSQYTNYYAWDSIQHAYRTSVQSKTKRIKSIKIVSRTQLTHPLPAVDPETVPLLDRALTSAHISSTAEPSPEILQHLRVTPQQWAAAVPIVKASPHSPLKIGEFKAAEAALGYGWESLNDLDVFTRIGTLHDFHKENPRLRTDEQWETLFSAVDEQLNRELMSRGADQVVDKLYGFKEKIPRKYRTYPAELINHVMEPFKNPVYSPTQPDNLWIAPLHLRQAEVLSAAQLEDLFNQENTPRKYQAELIEAAKSGRLSPNVMRKFALKGNRGTDTWKWIMASLAEGKTLGLSPAEQAEINRDFFSSIKNLNIVSDRLRYDMQVYNYLRKADPQSTRRLFERSLRFEVTLDEHFNRLRKDPSSHELKTDIVTLLKSHPDAAGTWGYIIADRAPELLPDYYALLKNSEASAQKLAFEYMLHIGHRGSALREIVRRRNGNDLDRALFQSFATDLPRGDAKIRTQQILEELVEEHQRTGILKDPVTSKIFFDTLDYSISQAPLTSMGEAKGDEAFRWVHHSLSKLLKERALQRDFPKEWERIMLSSAGTNISAVWDHPWDLDNPVELQTLKRIVNAPLQGAMVAFSPGLQNQRMRNEGAIILCELFQKRPLQVATHFPDFRYHYSSTPHTFDIDTDPKTGLVFQRENPEFNALLKKVYWGKPEQLSAAERRVFDIWLGPYFGDPTQIKEVLQHASDSMFELAIARTKELRPELAAELQGLARQPQRPPLLHGVGTNCQNAWRALLSRQPFKRKPK